MNIIQRSKPIVISKNPEPGLWWNTIRGRLTILNLGMLSLLFGALMFGQYFFLESYLNGQLTNSLRTSGGLVVQRQQPGQPVPAGRTEQIARNHIRIATELVSKETLAFVIASNGDIFTAATIPPQPGNPPPPNRNIQNIRNLNQIILTTTSLVGTTQEYSLPIPENSLIQKVLAGETDISYNIKVNGSGWGAAIVVLIPVRSSNSGDAPPPTANQPINGVAVVVGNAENNRSALTGLLTINLLAFVILLGIVSLSSPLLVRNSLKSLRLMIKTSQQIAIGDLSQRVYLPKTSNDEVGQLALTFNQMVDQLESLFQTQRQLVADASHELRTPLTAIKGSLEVLLIGGVSNDPIAANSLMKSVYQEVNRLSRLVNDLLTLSRLDQGEELKIQPLKLIPFLNSIKNSAELLNQQSGKELKIELIHPSLDKEPQILAAPDQLNQVLYNIVDNAIKFSPPRGTIWLELLPEVSWEPATNQQITKEHPSVHSRKVIAKSEINQEYYTLIIKDQGEGISHQDLPHIFDRFFRSDASRSRQKGGNGLGLAIAKDLVEKQGGMIRVESNLGIGSSFYISLAKLS